MARQVPPPRDACLSAESSRHFRRSDPCGLSSFFRKLFIYMWLSAEEESSKGSEVKEMLVAHSPYAENKAEWPGSFQIRYIKCSRAAEARAKSRVSALLINSHILVTVHEIHPLHSQLFHTRGAQLLILC